MNRPNYGLDAPGIVRTFLVLGPLLLVAGVTNLVGVPALAVTMTITGLLFVVEGGWMAYGSRFGKLAVRDHVLDRLGLRGDETVLDVGCGHGLLLIGAAKRVPRGKAVGIDLWSQTDQADNRKAATLENARLEGVTERVEVVDGDMRTLPFAEGSMDAVVASLSIHNIPTREGRRAAIREIARVLRPGGQVALVDFRKTAEYAEDLSAAGIQAVTISGPMFGIFPPVRAVMGRK